MENLESGIGLEKVGHWRCAPEGDIGTLSCSFLSLLPGHPEMSSSPLMHASLVMSYPTLGLEAIRPRDHELKLQAKVSHRHCSNGKLTR